MTKVEKELDEYHLHADHQAVIRVWKALGITEYTGQHIAEHVGELKAEADSLRSQNVALRSACEAALNYFEKSGLGGLFTAQLLRNTLETKQ